MTQGDLASKVGVTRAAISQFELGDTVPSMSTLRKLGTALNCDLDIEWVDAPEPDQIIENNISLRFYPASSYAYLSTWVADPTQTADYLLNEKSSISVAFNNMTVLQVSDYDYEDAFIVEIKGNAMMPRYPHGSRYVAKRMVAQMHELQFSTGAHMILLRDKAPLFRRIISTKKGMLLLRADATGEEMELAIKDVESWLSTGSCAIFKLGQAAYLPIED